MDGQNGEPGTLGLTGNDGKLWYRKLNTFEPVIDAVRAATTTDGIRTNLKELAKS